MCANILDDELNFALIGLGLGLNVDEAIGWKSVVEFFGGIPHAAGGAAGFVGNETFEERLTIFGHAELAILDGINTFDVLICG